MVVGLTTTCAVITIIQLFLKVLKTYFHWFGLWCLMPLSTIFQLYRGDSVLVVEETGIFGENHKPVASH
jgi:hypothetical protein